MAAKVLIVEDQNAVMLQSLLELHGDGFEYETVMNGPDAVRWLGQHIPDLVLLDLRLPGVDGFTVLEAIRKIERCIPVIIVSAFGDQKHRQKARDLGADGFFQKPFDHGRLYRAMRALLASYTTAPICANTLQLPADGRPAELVAKYRRLSKLREKQARLGINTPVELEIEIEDLEREIAGLESENYNAPTGGGGSRDNYGQLKN